MFRKSLVFLTLLSAFQTALAADAAAWRGRSIYQVVTDRFARTDGSTTAACNTADRTFCGGTWRGIINKLDYIQGMGFDAIWISPVIQQIYGTTHSGEAYHGYWPKDYYQLSPNFGTEQDLRDLSKSLHDRGMYLMVDIVVNHYANWGETINWSQFVPFNDAKYFHNKCWIDWSRQTSVENCWMGDGYVPLPDLNTEDSYVQSTLNTYIKDFVAKYSVDGLRIDATKNIRKDFWPPFCKAAGVYCQGEVWTGEPTNLGPWQNYMDGLHNYPVKEAATRALQTTKGSMSGLLDTINSIQKTCRDPTLLGSFMENHDNARMGSLTSDIALLNNIAAFNIFAGGIPFVYYGQEQMLTAASDPNNREALWLTGYPTNSKLYPFFKTLNAIRKRLAEKDAQFLTAKASYSLPTTNTLQITKRGLIALVTNAGQNGARTQLDLTGASAGTAMVEALSCAKATVSRVGRLTVTLAKGAPQVWVPTSVLAGSGICQL